MRKGELQELMTHYSIINNAEAREENTQPEAISWIVDVRERTSTRPPGPLVVLFSPAGSFLEWGHFDYTPNKVMSNPSSGPGFVI